MKENTALTQLIEILKRNLEEVFENVNYSQGFGDATFYAIFEAEKLLKLEQEQIANAVIYGNRQEAYDGTEEIGKFYYNQTYLEESK